MNAVQLQRFSQWVFEHEARRDAQGRLKIYELPANDDGGKYEVAGITERFDHDLCERLKRLIVQGEYDLAASACRAYYVDNTNAVSTWSSVPAVECYLRDTMFNRGLKGTAMIVQIACGVVVDGVFGPISKAALTKLVATNAHDALRKLRAATERYEDEYKGARPNMRRGLVNRWNDRLSLALSMLDPQPKGGQS